MITKKPFSYEAFWTHRVRYRESDPMGIVYHTHYIDYFEIARTEAFREMGYSYREMEANGVSMPVIDLAVQYRSPARYDDLLSIRTIMTIAPPWTRIRFDYEVRRTNESDMLATGHVTLCFLDRARSRPIRAPREIVDLVDRLESRKSV